MRGAAGAVLWLGVVATAGAAAPPLLEETWEAAHVDGVKVGFVHTTVEGLDGGKRLRATAALDLTLRRHGALLRLRMEQGTEETLDGQVMGVFMRQHHGQGQGLTLVGTREGDRMHVRVDNGRSDRRLPWDDGVVGQHGLQRLLAQRRPRSGDSWDVLRYEPVFNSVLRVRVTVRGPEMVPVGSARRALLRVDLVPEKAGGPGASVRPPAAVWWLDGDFVPLRRQQELPGLGTMILTRCPRAQATAPPTGPGRLTDVGLNTLIPLNRFISRPHAARSAVYRITLRGDPEPGTALVSDGHQDVRDLRGDSFELHVHPVRRAPGSAEVAPALAEFLASCYFIDSADGQVRDLARRTAGGETDPWRKAVRLERWVKQTMRPDNAAPLVPASRVARVLRGDCRSYALLLAALCRAEGIPARTALGLLYVEKAGRPRMGFHAWAEVWIGGRWIGLDGTLGRGGVGAGHIKISDHGWQATRSLTPLLPVNRVLGRLAIEVLAVEAGD